MAYTMTCAILANCYTWDFFFVAGVQCTNRVVFGLIRIRAASLNCDCMLDAFAGTVSSGNDRHSMLAKSLQVHGSTFQLTGF